MRLPRGAGLQVSLVLTVLVQVVEVSVQEVLVDTLVALFVSHVVFMYSLLVLFESLVEVQSQVFSSSGSNSGGGTV